MDAAYFGNLAGATDIIFHPGSYFGQPAEIVLKKAIPRARITVLKNFNQAHNPVILRPETMGKIAMLGSLEDTLNMSREINGILPCLDFAHLHARAGRWFELIRPWNSWQYLNTYAKFLGDNALRTCTSTCLGSNILIKGERNHLPIQGVRY